MKRTYKAIVLAALLPLAAFLLLLSSCQVERMSPDRGVATEEVTVFEGIYEVPGMDTKTMIDREGKFYWTPGDAISVFFGRGTGGGSKFVAQTEEPKSTCNFEGVISVVEGGGEDGGNEVDYFWAAYPYSENTTCDGSTLTLEMPSVQAAVAPWTFAPGTAPTIARSLGLKLSFKNVWSGFGFYVTEPGYTKITFRGNRGEALAGVARIGIDETKETPVPYVVEIVEGVTEVSLVASGEGFIPNEYYFLQFFPQTFEGGFTAELSSATKVGKFVISESREFTRSNYRRFGRLNERFASVEDRVIKPSDIKDAVFSAYLFSQYDTDQNGELSVAEREAVTRIYVNERETPVVSAQGIEYFPNLTNLTFYGYDTWNSQTQQTERGALKTLNVSGNPKLEYLSCYGNQLTSLDVSSNPLLLTLTCEYNYLDDLNIGNAGKLETLYCYENSLQSLDISNCPELRELHLSGNRLTGLDISQNPKLTALYCSNNKISSLDLSQHKDLESLAVSYNPLSGIDFSVFTKLTYLECYRLELTSLDVSSMPDLVYLDCSHNKLTALDVTHNTKLQDLYCHSNQLQALDISQCSLLRNLNCEVNQLTELDVSENEMLSYLDAVPNPLVTLYIYEGQTIRDKYLPEGTVEVVKKAAPEGIAINEENFPDAQFRDYVSQNIDKNGDGSLSLVECQSVTNMNVCTDNITSLEGIKYFANLSRLNCYGSNYDWETQTASGKLTALDLSQNTSLQNVDCRYNQLTTLDVSMLPELRYLYCQYNLLAALDISHNPALQNLQCYHNRLTALDVSQNPQLQTLHCAENQLTTLDVSHNGLLEGLYCYSNNLSSLDVSNNPMLQRLDMDSNNQIRSIDLTQCTNLQSLSCGGTQLTALDLRAFTHLTLLYCRDCSNLETVFLPEGLEELANGAFAYCYALKEIQLPQSLKRIGNEAFRYCSVLTAISIPASVTYVGRNAFRYCNALTRVAVYAPAPPEGGDYMFDNTNDCPIGVPESAVEAYKAAPYWANYASRIFALGSGDNEDVGYNEW